MSEFNGKVLLDPTININIERTKHPVVGDLWKSSIYKDYSFCVIWKSDFHIGIGLITENNNVFSINLDTVTVYTIDDWNRIISVLVERDKYTWEATLLLTGAQSQDISDYIKDEFNVDSVEVPTPAKEKCHPDKKEECLIDNNNVYSCHFCGGFSRVVFANTNLCIECAVKLFTIDKPRQM